MSNKKPNKPISKPTNKPSADTAEKTGDKIDLKAFENKITSEKKVMGKKPAGEQPKAEVTKKSIAPKKKPPTKVKKPRKEKKGLNKGGLGFAPVLIMSLIAALAGGAIGIGGMQYLNRSDQTIDTLRNTLKSAQAQQEQTQKEYSDLKIQFNAFQKRTKRSADLYVEQNSENAQSAQSEIESLKAEVLALQEGAEQAQTAVNDLPDYTDDITALKKDLTALGSLKMQDGDKPALSLLSLVDRLDTLEKNAAEGENITEEEAEIVANKKMAKEERLVTLEGRLAVLEQKQKTLIPPKSVSPKPVFPKPEEIVIEKLLDAQPKNKAETLAFLIAEFPKETMLEAVSAQDAIAAKKPSWLQRTLSRHVKVRKDDAPDPRASIDAAQQALQNGDVKQALALIAKLNPPVRAVAAQWRDVAKKALKEFDF